MTTMTLSTSSIRAAIALASSLGVAACSGAAPASDAPAAAIPVTVASAAMADVADTFEAGGVVQAQTTATLTARILAPVTDVRAVAGDRVRAGQVLVVLDARDLAAHARRARADDVSASQGVIGAAAEQRAAEAVLALARSTHSRIATLHAKRSATAQELDDATAKLRGAEAQAAGAEARARAAIAAAQSARAGIDAAETTETFSRIVAPFDGVVTGKMVEPGNMAAPGMPLMRVEDTRRFRLDVRVDESRVASIAPGAPVAIALDGGPVDAPRVIDATIAEVSRAVDADARAFLVKIELPADPRLRSGMFGRARFTAQPRRALTVPAAALVHRGQVTSVFVVEKDIARVRLVNVSGTEVLAGLSDRDVVIVNPPAALTDGRRVRTGGR